MARKENGYPSGGQVPAEVDASPQPQWLKEMFPKQRWESLRSCRLHVDPELGAGLDMEATELGYLVEAVAASPGQEPILCAGDIIISIGGARLHGLTETDVEASFGANFADGAEALLLSADELRAAVIERDANAECPCELDDDKDEKPEDSGNYELLRRQKSSTEYDATVRIPVGRATQWKLTPDTLASFEQDLGFLGERYALSAQPHFNRDGGMEAVVLTGLSTAIAAARSEVIQILQYYREGKCEDQNNNSASAGAEAADGAGRWRDGASAGGEADKKLEVPAHVADLRQFEYHDHTADIIVHSWGTTRAEAFAQVCVGMFQYMTELSKIELVSSVDVEATGHDLLDLLYHLLDEFLFVFGTQMHVSRRIEIIEFDEKALRIRARGYGERMDLQRHEQGTEIKAITMHMMRVVDADVVISENGTEARAEVGNPPKAGFPHATYVLLDI